MFNRLKMILSRKKRGSKGPIPTPPDPHRILWEIMHPGKSFEEEMGKGLKRWRRRKIVTIDSVPRVYHGDWRFLRWCDTAWQRWSAKIETSSNQSGKRCYMSDCVSHNESNDIADENEHVDKKCRIYTIMSRIINVLSIFLIVVLIFVLGMFIGSHIQYKTTVNLPVGKVLSRASGDISFQIYRNEDLKQSDRDAASAYLVQLAQMRLDWFDRRISNLPNFSFFEADYRKSKAELESKLANLRTVITSNSGSIVTEEVNRKMASLVWDYIKEVKRKYSPFLAQGKK